MKKLIKLILWGLLFALSTEIYDNFIINDRPFILLLIIIPIYALLFLISFKIHIKLKLSPRLFSLIMGLIGLIMIENIILKKFVEPWPIQIFMFSYWFSIFSYPLLMLTKSKKILIRPFIIALVISIGSFPILKSVSIALPLLMVVFYVASAIGNFYHLKQVKIDLL